MGTYDNRNPTVSEPNLRTSLPHFAWINPGNFFSATKFGSNPFQPNPMHIPNPGPSHIPARFLAPLTELTKNTESETKPTKVKKKKSEPKSSNDTAHKVLSPKQPKKKPSASKKTKKQHEPGTKVERKNLDVVYDERINLDLSSVPPPFCSCTGVARGCYKWGALGWQSSCCTTKISEYPLPMNSSRPGARLGGRKMSVGVYGKLLCRLAAEGRDLSHPVDLKDHWARHGTNKFVTIR